MNEQQYGIPKDSSRLNRLAWLPIPILLALILGLWVAKLHVSYESGSLLMVLNVLFSWLVSICIGLLAARSFLLSGQIGLLMLVCGVLTLGFASMAAAALIEPSGNLTVTVHNIGALGAALCHLSGLIWRGRVLRPLQWLVTGCAGVLALLALVVWSAMAGWIPLFFVQGKGGTLIRQVVLISAIAVFALAAWIMLMSNRRKSSAFFYWYGMGLMLMAVGLTGVMLQSFHGSLLSWTGRLTQYLGGIYLLISAVVEAGETGTWKISLIQTEEAWRKGELLPEIQKQPLSRLVLRYGSAVVAVAVAFGLRQVISEHYYPGIPPYLMFAATGMVVVLFAGFGPGVLATLLTGLVVAYWILPPVGQFAIASPADRLGMLIYTGVSLFFCTIVELYRRNRDKAAAYDREEIRRESRERLATFAEMTFEGIVESEAGRISDCNEQFARMLGYTVHELKGMEIIKLVASEDRARVMANIVNGQNSTIEHIALRKDGTRIFVEAHGRSVSPGSLKRHTAIRDITERKRAEESLQQERDQLSSLIQSIRDEVWFTDADGRFTLVNPSGNREFALNDTEPVDVRKFAQELEVLRPDGTVRPVDESPPLRALRGEVVTNQEEIIRTPARGEFRYRQVSAAPVHNSQGGIIGSVSVVRDITEFKQAETALAASELRYRRLFESAKDGILILDAETGTIVDVNPFLITLLGFSREAFLQKKIWELGVFKDIVANQSSFAELQDKEYIRYEDKPLEAADGRRIEVEFVSNVYKVDGSKVIQCNIRDITERKRAEAELARLSALMTEGQEIAHVGSFEYIAATQETVWSAEEFRIYGLDPSGPSPVYEEMLAKSYLPEDASLLHQTFSAAMQTGCVYELEHRILRPDGSIRWVYDRAHPHFDQHGKLVRYVGVTLDITERKRAEEALAAAHRQLQSVIDNTTSMVYACDLEARFVMANAALAALLQTTPAQMLGKRRHEFMPQEDADKHEANDREVIAAGRAVEFEEHSELTGRSFTWLSTKFPLRDAQGRIYAVAGIVTDISARKQAENELRHTLEELERSNKELEQFAYVASHDLQEPLRTVSNFMGLLQARYKGRLDSKADEFIGFAVDGAERMSSLVRDLLAYSRAGRQGAKVAPVRCDDALDKALRNLHGTIAEQNVRVTHDDLPTVMGDVSQLSQLFQNLIGNAIKFRSNGINPEIHVSARVIDDGKAPGQSPRKQWLFSVRDNGIGIDPQFNEKVFMIFQRLHTHDKYPGTGIGLAICKKIVEHYGGRIWVESEPGKGSTFFFTLPALMEGSVNG